MKKLLSILFCLSITLFIYSQEVTVSSGHSVQENKTTKVILNAVNGSVRIHKHVLEGTGFGYSSGSAWNDDLGYISTRTTTTVNTSTTEYLCDTPAELTVDKPVKLSIGGYNDYSFVINPTGGTQYWEIRNRDYNKATWGLIIMLSSILPVAYATYDIVTSSFDNYFPIWGIVSGAAGTGLFVTGSIFLIKSDFKITLLKIEY